MRLTILILILLVRVSWANDSYAQNAKISIDAQNQSIAEILETVELQSEFSFIYDSKSVDTERKVSVYADEDNIFDVLSQMFAGSEIAYTVINKKIILNKSEEILSPAQQGITITGTIVDTSGEPLPGVTILIKGTSIGNISDVNGKYTINVPDRDAVLTFSFIGFISREYPVGNQTIINVTLSEDTQVLDEVVVVGYGVQRKLSVTNAISIATSSEISARNSTNVNQALQGKLPGLTILDKGGQPGAESLTLRIRGVTSLNSNDALILIDGVPGNLSQVNPVDIESVSVLKDAASSAIYGSRAAAGVVLVTTKAPKDGKVSITYNGFMGWARSNNNPEHMDAVTYMIHQNHAYMNTEGRIVYSDEDIKNWPANHARDPENYPKPNIWREVMFHVAPQHSHTLTLSGGNQAIKNRVSFRYLDQDGIIDNFNFKISELRSRNEFKLSKKLSFDSNVNVRLTERRTPQDAGGTTNRMNQNSQWGVPYYSDGSYGLSVDYFSPLILAKERGISTYRNTYLSGIFSGDYQIIDALKFHAQYSTQVNYLNRTTFTNEYDFVDKLHPDRRMRNPVSSMTDRRNWWQENGIDLQLIYQQTFAKHALNGILGYSQIHNKGDWVEGYRQGFYNNDLQALSQGANDGTRNGQGGNYEWGLRSYFTRINYDYDGKYLLEVNGRYDGSSMFAQGRQYGFFPSASIGWRVSGENFWDPVRDVINNFKIRGSWGEVGSQQVWETVDGEARPAYSFMKTYGTTSYIFNNALASGYRQMVIANNDISWETTTQLNFGIDAYLFNNKINLMLDYYKKTTSDILLSVPIPQIMGLDAARQNAGIVENKGFEILLGARQAFGDFNVEMGFNVTYNQNKVIDLAGTGPHISTGGNTDWRTINTEGYPITSFYGYKVDGMFQSWEEVNNYAKWDGSVGPGDLKYVDINNDGLLTPDDWVILGKEFPDWTFSSNMAVSWKNLTLDLFWQGVAGSQKPMTGAIMEHGIWGGFTHKRWSDYWTEDNRNSKNPRPTKLTMKNAQMSEWTMLNGAYLRLKNVRLSYDIPKKYCNLLKVGAINVYVSSTNMLTFSQLNSYNIDPEMIGRDQEGAFPQTSVTTVGLNINF